jgi:AcrR family transcriptional regulator
MLVYFVINMYDAAMGKVEINQAAFEFFALKGFDGCTLQEIADKVGINKATIYSHYSSKEELFLTVLSEQINTYSETVKNAVDENINEPLNTILFNIVQAFFDNSPLDRLLLWKKTLLMVVSDSDEGVRASSRQVIYQMNQLIYKTLNDLFLSKGVDTSTPQFSRFINSYYIFIQSILDWILLNAYRMNRDVNTILADLWDNFWNGSKIE